MATSRHLWVGGLPDGMKEDDIRDYFTKYGKVESVKLLPQKHGSLGLAAFVDFYELEAAKEAHNDDIKLKGSEVRTNYKSFRSETKEGKGHSRRYYNSPDMKNDSSNSSSSGTSTEENSSDSSSDSERSDSSKKDALVLKITNLPHRSDRELLGSLHSEFSSYSSKMGLKVFGDGDKKYAFVKFKRVEDCTRALDESQGTRISGCKIKLSPHHKDVPSGGRDYSKVMDDSISDDVDSNATRSLFVGNIPKNISIYELRDIFQRYGPILDVEIKKMSGSATYGFILYYDLHCAITAKRCMDGRVISGNKIRVGFGKGTVSKVLWIDCIDHSVTEHQLEKYFAKYGRVTRIGYDHYGGTAIVQFDTIEEAKEALVKVKGTTIGTSGRKIMADFANKDAKVAFFARLDQLEGPAGPRPFHPSGPMYPMEGIPPTMMMVPSPHMDYYRPYPPPPYIDDYYRGSGYHAHPHPRLPPMRHAPYESRGFGDYEDELKAFSRKRDRERRNEQRDEERKKRRHGHYSSGEDSSDSSGDRGRRRRKRRSSSSKRGDSSDDNKGDARAKITRRSRERKERHKNNRYEKGERRDKKSSSVSEPTRDEEKSRKKVETKEVKKSEEEMSDGDKQTTSEPVNKKEFPKPKVVINYEEEEESTAPSSKKTDNKDKSKSPPVIVAEKHNPPTDGNIPAPPEDNEETDAAPLPPEPEEETLLPVTVRPKISIAWKERDKPHPLQQTDESNDRIESDLSSGDDFQHAEEDEVKVNVEEGLSADKLNPNDTHTLISEQDVSSNHSSNTDMKGEKEKRGINKSKDEDRESDKRGVVREHEERYRHHYNDRGGMRRRNYDHRAPPTDHTHRHQHRRHRMSPSPRGPRSPPHRSRPSRSRSPLIKSGSPPTQSRSPSRKSKSPPTRPRSPPTQSMSPPTSPHRNRARTPIQRPPRHRQHGSPQHDTSRTRHARSPPPHYLRRREVRSDTRDRRRREYSPRRDRSRGNSPTRHASPVRQSSFRGHRYDKSRSPSPPTRYPSRSHLRKEDTRNDVVPARPRTPSGSPPPLPPEEPATEEVTSNQNEEPPHSDVHDLMRRYPVMWQGHFVLKSELVAVQLHYLSGNSNLVQLTLSSSDDGKPPTVRISQRMKMEQSQLDGVEKRIKNATEHCLLLAFPCGRDPADVQNQAAMLNNTIINYLLQKQAAGIVNIQNNEGSFVLHIFPPCAFSSTHLTQAASDLLNSTTDQCHLMIIIVKH